MDWETISGPEVLTHSGVEDQVTVDWEKGTFSVADSDTFFRDLAIGIAKAERRKFFQLYKKVIKILDSFSKRQEAEQELIQIKTELENAGLIEE